ncbi:Unconventional Myosin-Ie [Manis pentadactyla]|nr:Unconventional Myosin-Ie [Manis pentadactyla]
MLAPVNESESLERKERECSSLRRGAPLRERERIWFFEERRERKAERHKRVVCIYFRERGQRDELERYAKLLRKKEIDREMIGSVEGRESPEEMRRRGKREKRDSERGIRVSFESEREREEYMLLEKRKRDSERGIRVSFESERREREYMLLEKRRRQREMLFSFEETEERGKREMLAPVNERVRERGRDDRLLWREKREHKRDMLEFLERERDAMLL